MKALKNCILLSNKNIDLMSYLREKCNNFSINLYPCKSIDEMINLFNQGANAVLVEYLDCFKNVKSYLSSYNYDKVFYIKENNIFDINYVLRYNNINTFLNSEIFCTNIIDNNNANKIVDDRLKSLNVTFNCWQNRCIKFILVELIKLNNINKLNDILKYVSVLNGIKLKLLYDELRPFLIEITKTLIPKNIKKLYSKNMIKILYDYCLKTA